MCIRGQCRFITDHFSWNAHLLTGFASPDVLPYVRAITYIYTPWQSVARRMRSVLQCWCGHLNTALSRDGNGRCYGNRAVSASHAIFTIYCSDCCRPIQLAFSRVEGIAMPLNAGCLCNNMCIVKSIQHLGLSPVRKAQHQIHNRLQRRRSIGFGRLLCRWCCVIGGTLLRNAPRCQDKLLHALWWQLLAMFSAWTRTQYSYTSVSICRGSCKLRSFLNVDIITDAAALEV